jgi:hypothetical protein
MAQKQRRTFDAPHTIRRKIERRMVSADPPPHLENGYRVVVLRLMAGDKSAQKDLQRLRAAEAAHWRANPPKGGCR